MMTHLYNAINTPYTLLIQAAMVNSLFCIILALATKQFKIILPAGDINNSL